MGSNRTSPTSRPATIAAAANSSKLNVTNPAALQLALRGASNQGAYPITITSFVLAYGNYKNSHLHSGAAKLAGVKAFLNYAYRTGMTGVALHAAIGAHELRDMGHRASGGCVRLPLEKADALFHRFQAEERGQVPVFIFDEARGTTNVDGTVAGAGAGRIYVVDGVRVLVIIEDYSGNPVQS